MSWDFELDTKTDPRTDQEILDLFTLDHVDTNLSISTTPGHRVLSMNRLSGTADGNAYITSIGTVSDVEVYFRTNRGADATWRKGPFVRGGNDGSGRYAYVASPHENLNNVFEILRRDPASNNQLGTQSSAATLDGSVFYWIKIRVEGDQISAIAWDGDLVDEPASGHLTVTDSTYTTGTVGARFRDSSSARPLFFDEIYVRILGTTGPALTLPTLTATGETTATGTVTTDTATGTMYAYVSTSATPPSAADLKAGTGAVWSGDQAISTTGEKTFSVTGLTAGTLYYVYYLHNDGTDDSSIVTASATTNAAATGPSLSAASGAATGATTADGSVTTDTANGTLYAVLTQSATAPSVAQVQAGNDHTGTAANWSGSQAVSTTGEKTFSADALEPSTAYYWHFQHRDSALDDSTVVSSASFTTEALLGWTVDPAVSAVTTNSITVTATPNQTADVYGVAVLAGSAAPSSAQVIAGQNAAGTAAEAADSDLNVTGAATLLLNSTLDDPLYDVYVVATTA